MGSPVTLNTVRAACTPAARRKVLNEVNDAEIKILKLQKSSEPEMSVSEYRNSWPDGIAKKFIPQHKIQQTRKETGLNHQEICGDLDTLDLDRKDYNVDVKKRDFLKIKLDALRAKYPNVVKRPPGIQAQIDNLRDEWLKLRENASEGAEYLKRDERRILDNFTSNSSDVLFKQK
jgi:hypothetical protein